MVDYTNKKTKDGLENYKELLKEKDPENLLRFKNDMKSEFSMFGLIFNQVAIIRSRTSDLGSIVRINNSDSPSFLDAYHTQIYAFLEQIAPVIPQHLWTKIFNMWIKTKHDINDYQRKRRTIHNMKIPFELILTLDKLHRIAILAAQRGGLGINLVADVDINKEIENTIVGS